MIDPSAAFPGEGPAAAPRRRSAWRLARRGLPALGVMLVAVLAIRALSSGGSELSRAARLLSHPAAGWLVAAAAVEALSFLLYARAQRRLARAAGARLGAGWLMSLAVAAQALNNFLPAGYLAANVLNFRELRRRGLSRATGGWLLVATSLLFISALAALALVGSLIAGGQGGTVADDLQLGAGAVLGVLALGAGAAVVLARRGTLRRAGRRVAAGVQRRGGRLGELGGSLRALWAQLSEVRLDRRAALAAWGLLAAGWLADAACLVCGFAAIGGPIPWGSLLMAYCAAQLVTFVPATPGGLGLMEGSLTVALTVAGGSAGHALAAVLIYRALSYWATLPAGLAGYAVVRRRASRPLPSPLAAPAVPVAAVPLETAATP